MVLVGLGVLIASVSFLFYAHPPRWSFLNWFRRPSPTLTETAQVGSNAAVELRDAPHDATPQLEDGPQTKETADSEDEEVHKQLRSGIESQKADQPAAAQRLDRVAMPPPDLPGLRTPVSGDTTPKAWPMIDPSVIPSLMLDRDADDDEHIPPPLFPAMNSAQRASTTNTTSVPADNRMGPPRLPPATSSLRPTPRSGPAGPLPNRGPPTSLAAPASAASAGAGAGSRGRQKVLLRPGHSPLDWARLTASPTANLRGVDPATPYLRVPPSLLKTQNGRKGRDAWTVLGGRVYNISPYAPFHPGGEGELLRAAGKDGTKLFRDVHPWVNWEGMLEACLVGLAVEEGEGDGQGVRESWLEQMD